MFFIAPIIDVIENWIIFNNIINNDPISMVSDVAMIDRMIGGKV
jgi:hypothetical protein